MSLRGDPHPSHCWQGEQLHGCKYGDDEDCTAKPTVWPHKTYDERGRTVWLNEDGSYTGEDGKTFLWEILVPTVHNNGTPFRLQKDHKPWDKKVRDISGGLTIMKPAVGEWVDPHTGDIYRDRTIPVRFVATRTQMLDIVDMTCIHYEQLAILCYRIADEVVFRTIEEATNAKSK